MDEKVSTLWKLADLMEGHHPWPVPPELLHLSSLKKFLPGNLAFHGQLELPSGWLLPLNIDGPASTAIWANCWVNDNSSDLPTSPNFSTPALLLSDSPGIGRASTSGPGGSASAGDSTGSICTSNYVHTCRAFLPPILGIFFMLVILEKKTSQSEARAAMQESRDICFALVILVFWRIFA